MRLLGRARGSKLAFACVTLSAGVDRTAEAVLPTAALQLSNGESTYAAPAWFGLQVSEGADAAYLPIRVPSGRADGCEDVTVDDAPEGGFVLVVERGNCFFDTKAIAAQEAGAKGLIVMNSVEGIYQEKGAATDKYDYECSNGQGWVQSLESPLWSPSNTDEACWSNAACDSGVCVVTNDTDATLGHKVCCAWDLYITMYGSEKATVEQVAIPSVYVTMADGEMLLEAGQVDVKMFNRPRNYINLSSFLLWGLGVVTVAWASVKSANDIRWRLKAVTERGGSSAVNYGGASHEESPSLELGVRHTLVFVVFASGMLMLLFFFNLGLMFTLLFCVSATTATGTILVLPGLRRVRLALVDAGILWSDGDGGVIDCACFGVFSGLEILSTATALALAMWWLLVRNTASYAWILQDLFGCCLSATFLSTIRLPSIKVATFLLCLAFLYDIFWVFLSPQLFGESVMVKVATGGEITQDPTYCEKYPTSDGCQVESLPMLLELPRVWDYMGGYAMLGLGDIVIPGLLLSFAHRYDVSVGLPLKRGYFVFMVAGYAVGLLMANMAVYVMAMGQPALLYLVPCTLGLFVFISYNDGTLRSMWDGPPSLSADHAGYDGLLSDESSIGGHEGGEGGRGGGAQLSGRDGVSPLSDSGSGRRGSELRSWGTDYQVPQSSTLGGGTAGGWRGNGVV